jgi:UrcA family protein
MLITSLAALTTSLTLTPLAVAADESVPTQIVHFHTDELSSEAGWDEIESRIRVATSRVCRPHGLRGLVAQRIRQECFNSTYADAIRQLNREYAEANSRSVAAVVSAQ